MAFNDSTFGGYVGGSVFTPGIFKLTTPDTFAEVTTAGYIDKDSVPALNVGDFVFVTTQAGTVNRAGNIAIVATKNIYDNGTPNEVDLSAIGTYAGDVRATDPAGFQKSNFGGNLGAGSSTRLFTYRNNTDDKATIAAPDYFLDLGLNLMVDDLILTIANDGATILRVTAVGSTVTVTVNDLVPV